MSRCPASRDAAIAGPMGGTGKRIDEMGMLIRDGGGFALRRDAGGRYRLDMHRVPVDQVEKRVRITGFLVDSDLVDVIGVATAD